MITIRVSLGEALDRVSILRLKAEKIDTHELQGILHTVAQAYEEVQFPPVPEVEALYNELYRVNSELWNVEDGIRDALIDATDWTRMGPFIELAMQVPKLNDERSKIKQQINTLVGDIGEVKSYGG
jgi:hypothetical protein